MTSFTVIIPARYDSTRLPGKVLEDIAGKPMLQWVYEQSLKSGAERVVIATDDDRIRDAAERFGAPVCMTSADHSSGTERIAEAAEALELDDDDIIIGVQGDEPLIPVETIRKVAASLDEHEHVRVASACELINDQAELFSPHVTKVILNRRHYAMYFSRAPIPWELGNFAGREVPIVEGDHYRHIGLYGYRPPFLREYSEWEPCSAELMEKLEQLRILWHGGRLHMTILKHTTPPGVDTQEDLNRVRELMKRKK